MDFRQLRNFIQVVELSSITAAAERLNIAQPALSRQVKALEDELNVSLLRRHGRGVMPGWPGAPRPSSRRWRTWRATSPATARRCRAR